MEIIGSGHVTVVDGHNITYSNADVAEEGHPLAIENLLVHVMVNGNFYNMEKRKFFTSEKEAYSK